MDNRRLDIAQITRKLQSVQETEKTFSLTSEIQPNTEKWGSGSTFTCKSTHNNNEFMKTINICEGEYVRCVNSVSMDDGDFKVNVPTEKLSSR